MQQLFTDQYELTYWTNIFERVFLEGKPDSWAYIWTFTCWSQSGLTILPNYNLISNIGFGEDATHTQQTDSNANLPTKDIWEIKHPPFVVRHQDADRYTFDRNFGGLQMKKANTIYGKTRKMLSKIKKSFEPWLN